MVIWDTEKDIPIFSWSEKRHMRKLIKSLKQAIELNTKKEKDDVQRKNKIVENLMQLTELMDIESPKTKKTITHEELQTWEYDNLVDFLEEGIKELENLLGEQ